MKPLSCFDPLEDIFRTQVVPSSITTMGITMYNSLYCRTSRFYEKPYRFNLLPPSSELASLVNSAPKMHMMFFVFCEDESIVKQFFQKLGIKKEPDLKGIDFWRVI